jgi:hypothetical protein
LPNLFEPMSLIKSFGFAIRSLHVQVYVTNFQLFVRGRSTENKLQALGT